MQFSNKISLYKFLYSNIDYQLQANFEFRYPVLFRDDSFLIDQLDFPQLDKNVGYVWLDGFQIPVHSKAKFGNEIRFTMYVEDNFLGPNGKYNTIFNALVSDNYAGITNTDEIGIAPCIADIIPLRSEKKSNINGDNFSSYYSAIRLYNALIKSISLDGGFSANSIALSKFSVTMTFSLFDIE